MNQDPDYLFHRLPALYRLRDADQGNALQAYLALLGEQATALEADIDQLYRNWFIETCDNWVVPYIADLLGVRLLRAISGTPTYSLRALVADTLSLRRRKGTVGALETLARDCTGWPVHAVEFFQLLETTQNVNHVRLANVRTPDLRDSAHLELLDGPFDDIAHTAALKALPNGRYNIPNIGLFAWRLQSYPVSGATPYAAQVPAGAAVFKPGLYYFNPLGLAEPLFNRPQPLSSELARALEINLPVALRRRALFDELANRRALVAAGKPPPQGYFNYGGTGGAVLTVVLDGAAIPPENIYICDIADQGSPVSDWSRPAAGPTPTVAVDPERGRLSFPTGVTPQSVAVSYQYAFSGDLGGGPYDRRGLTADDPAALVAPGADRTLLQVVTPPATASAGAQGYATAAAAFAALVAYPPGARLTLEFIDDATYPANATLALGGLDVVIQAANRHRPVLSGDLTLIGDANTRINLNGLTLDGALILSGPIAEVSVSHTTISPLEQGLSWSGLVEASPSLLNLRRTLCGPLSIPGALRALNLSESVIDGAIAAGSAIAAASCPATIDRCTVLGTTQLETLSASDCLFTEDVTVSRCQEGCVRFSYVTLSSAVPQQYRCQPALAAQGLADPSQVAIRLTPDFTSETYGDPGYTQLSQYCAPELTTGADNGAEMGVWNFLQQPQRAGNFANALDDYLRFGMAAALLYVT